MKAEITVRPAVTKVTRKRVEVSMLIRRVGEALMLVPANEQKGQQDGR